jgi:putative methyltransferase (TIGR04325 family)
MSSAIKSITKSLVLSIPYAREKYFEREFSKRSPSCKGVYDTFAAAALDSPSNKLAGYDHRVISEFYKGRLDELNKSDYPVLYWLGRLLPETKYVFELGGSVGMGYYAYRRYIPFPDDVRWTICELPEAVQVGTEIALDRNDTSLSFTTERQTAEDPDLYATFGALQYIEEPFAQIISELRKKPPHILINRVPLIDGKRFITLQNNGLWFSPYKVDNRAEFIQGLEDLGYELVDKWEMNRPNSFLLALGDSVPTYNGMYFRLNKTPSSVSR